VTLILCQFWHIWACRTRLESMFRPGWATSNRITITGCVAAVVVVVVVVYGPACQAGLSPNPAALCLTLRERAWSCDWGRGPPALRTALPLRPPRSQRVTSSLHRVRPPPEAASSAGPPCAAPLRRWPR